MQSKKRSSKTFKQSREVIVVDEIIEVHRHRLALLVSMVLHFTAAGRILLLTRSSFVSLCLLYSSLIPIGSENCNSNLASCVRVKDMDYISQPAHYRFLSNSLASSYTSSSILRDNQASKEEASCVPSTKRKSLGHSQNNLEAPRMITDVQLAALSNWLGSFGMVLIVIYHVGIQNIVLLGGFTSADKYYLLLQLFAVNARRVEGQRAAAALASAT